MPTLKAAGCKQEAGPCDEIDSKQNRKAMSAFDLEVRPHCCWIPGEQGRLRFATYKQNRIPEIQCIFRPGCTAIADPGDPG
jgi:hypothetical protein